METTDYNCNSACELKIIELQLNKIMRDKSATAK